MVTGAVWDETRQKWAVEIQQTNGHELVRSQRHGGSQQLVGTPFMKECDILINASGFVNDWKWPSIPGRESFRGKTLHTAAYDQTIDLRGKKVAVIGNGSSGVQVLASITDEVASVTAYMRSPAWITPGFAITHAPKGLTFSEETKEKWTADPSEYLKYRKALEAEINAHFKVYLKDSEDQKVARKRALAQLQGKLARKPELAAKLTPDFAVGYVQDFIVAAGGPS